jgi:hypothetical protein
MSEAQTAAPATKTPVERTEIKMEDGRTVSFAGKRQADKTVTIDTAAGTVEVQIDFRNGKTVKVTSGELDEATLLMAMGHGLSQKVGDEYSGEKEVDDMYLAADDMVQRLKKGEWTAPRAAGDGFSGASIVIKAIVEATGKTVEWVKAFLNGKLEAAKAKGEKLSRADLYNSFRNPASKTGVIIKRLEEERLAKTAKLSSADLLAEIEAA